ncbi:uncharacterized protein LOC121725233 [Aricia agestis]|uniref:uncharacterized protein LOC121725233 n=1 Tax=Aricia agestis TaxID=91739 RepID=UPI001C203A4A|nr:uncharacterized protein LOC121725233 [Aricia agestis]
MDQRVQCPVCTLYLHSGMSLESHLDTHPKDQVIKALCSLSARSSTFGSRTSTPTQSERSYRSRSRTPANEESVRWMTTHKNSENERYWRRTPSRTKSTPFSYNTSRVGTPELRMGNLSFDNHNFANNNGSDPYTIKIDKTQQTHTSINTRQESEFEQQFPYYSEQNDDPEIKYSRSSEYTGIDNSNNIFTYNMPTIAPNLKLQATMVPSTSKKSANVVKILPKPSNILVKTNVAGVQYIPPGVKPLHVVLPTSTSFVQKTLPNHMIMTGNLASAPILDPKSVAQPLANQFEQLTTNSVTPGTTVVTQNSQIIYREMVHNLDGKPFISSMPAVLGTHENVTNVAQSNSIYQNVMVVDQFGNTSCMYTTPQPLLSKPCPTTIFNSNLTSIPHSVKQVPQMLNNANETLIIDVNPLVPSTSNNISNNAGPSSSHEGRNKNASLIKAEEKADSKIDSSVNCKGLKILSNVKVEVPVQHHKNMLNTVLDLTGPNESEYTQRPLTPEKILPDLDDNLNMPDEGAPASNGESFSSHTFSVIKNVGNPPSYRESSKTNISHKLETEFSDSCPVPDLTCNEKPSISPCSELSEHGESATDPAPITRKQEINNETKSSTEGKKSPTKLVRNMPLPLNNIYVKKHKKILQIKNSKTCPPSTSTSLEFEPKASSSKSLSSENFTLSDIGKNEEECFKKSFLQTISIEKIENQQEADNQTEFDADTEERSMDIEPVASSRDPEYPNPTEIVKVKEEVNSSNDFSNEGARSCGEIAPMETLRPINVITYGNMVPENFDEDSNHRELLELEAASKNKQFVNMMNDNYFGDNIYADYFTPDRVESFEAEKESHYNKENTKDPMYMWGEPSQKESEFVLPNFIHESYRIAESSEADYSELTTVDVQLDNDADRCDIDNKADVLSESRSEGEPILNICTDERMPPRGELSGQESNGDLESTWGGMYAEVPPAEPYDLMARESWVSDGSDVDTNEKLDALDDFPKTKSYSCSQCAVKFPSLKELRGHKSLAHALPTCSTAKTSYSRLVTSRTIKKEVKQDEVSLSSNLMVLESKRAITTTILQAYDVLGEAKPKIEGLIKQEKKRKRRDYVCPTCKEDQGTDAAFHAHLKIHPLECLTCGKCFFRRANLALHIKTHLGIKNYKCDICEKRFITRQKLSEHHNIHTGRAPFKCTMCDDTFRRYSNMVQHRDRHHLKKKARVRDFVCACGLVFHSAAKLLWHRETHDERPKACPYCSDKFVHAASLTRHVRRSHNALYVSERLRGKVDNVPCPVCKQVYLRTNLRAHMQTHSGKRNFHCVICNKYFTTKWNLKLHRWTHMSRSAKPYKCTLCKGAFIRQSEYISHMNAHKSVRPYTCNYCGCQFIRKTNCQRHVREHEMAKKYVCKVPECGKSFHRSYYLSEHMKVHSNSRPFSCNICGKTSSNKSNHNKHVKIHHAREPIATEA